MRSMLPRRLLSWLFAPTLVGWALGALACAAGLAASALYDWPTGAAIAITLAAAALLAGRLRVAAAVRQR